MSKVKDTDYLFLSAMLKAKRDCTLDSERLEHLLGADISGAVRQLAEYGFGDMEGLDSAGVDAALASLRARVFDEVASKTPDKAAVDIFRAKYDCHNAKALVKSVVSGVDASRLLSLCGTISPEDMAAASHTENGAGLPKELALAVTEAKTALSKTGNPQLAELILDKWYFAELHRQAALLGNPFAETYVRMLTDSANLRSAVRILRLGGDRELFAMSQFPGGSTVISAPTAEAVADAYDGTPFSVASEIGADAVKGGDLTAVETMCDRAVAQAVAGARRITFGVECIIAYLAGVEADIAAARMIMSMKLVGMDAAGIRERLGMRL